MAYVPLKKLEARLSPLNVLIRCDASIQIGLGHVTRCLVLANELKDKGHFVYFAMKDYQLGINKVKEQGFQCFLPPAPFDYHQWITSLSVKLATNIFIGDVRDGLPIATIEYLKSKKMLTVAIDEPSDYRKACDLCFYPPHAQLEELDWKGFKGKIKQGLEYVLLRPEFYQTHQKKPNLIPHVMVMMGGTDPHKLTLNVIQALLANTEKKQIDVVISKSHPDYQILKKLSTCITLHHNITNMAAFLLTIDTAVISFGTIAYELIAMRCPAVYICLNEKDWSVSEYFEQQKWAKRLTLSDLDDINPFMQIEPAINNAIQENMITTIIYQKVGYGF